MSVLITGCSSGIGLHVARRLKEEGEDVIASCRKNSDVLKLKELGLKCVQLDVNDSDSIKKGVSEAIALSDEHFISGLINNAGFVQPGAVEDLTRESLNAQFNTNVFGVCELTNLLLPKMRERGRGRIVNISSILGVFPLAFTGAYNASKHALEGLTRTLQLEFRNAPIQVSLVQPGPIHSNIRENCIAQHLAPIDLSHSFYKEQYHKMLRSYKQKKQESFLTESPEAVYKKVKHALYAKRAKKTYPVTLAAYGLFFLKRLMPQTSFDWVLSKISSANV